MNKKDILYAFLALIISSGIFFVGYTKAQEPIELYRVYLKGETIGYIENKELLEEYIDNEQVELKEKYNVDKVYLPNDLDIVREVTFNKKVSTEKEIYEKIKDIAPFTVNGYIITIKGVEDESNEENVTEEAQEEEEKKMLPDQKIYVLNKEIFTNSLKNTVMVFISQQDYDNFINKTQPEIKNVGSIIEDIYIKNQITITEGRISTEERIFTSADELNKYMLFGTTEEQKKYKVKAGDSISDIAFKNKLSVEEFLIANPEFTSENNLLYEGQMVNLGLINPLFKLVEEDHVVEVQNQKYETKIEYDPNTLAGYERVKQEGSNGTIKITKKVQKVNGEIVSAVITNKEVIKEAVPKIIVKGSKVMPTVGNVGLWGWPTAKPYCITSPYGWRGGKIHEALDISCAGCGSPIYAANNGTVEKATYVYPNGNYIVINHNNGYYTIYAHLQTILVKEGQVVQMGDLIGKMGSTGKSTGCHLHFGISSGYPYRGTYQFYNPASFY